MKDQAAAMEFISFFMNSKHLEFWGIFCTGFIKDANHRTAILNPATTQAHKHMYRSVYIVVSIAAAGVAGVAVVAVVAECSCVVM